MKIEDRERLEARRGQQLCTANGYLHYRRFANGRDAALMPLLYTVAIITDLTEWGYGDRWCYHTLFDASEALDAWDGGEGTEPTGWHRHPDTGRRREDGDPAREEVRP
jgi:hypothetical protein